MSIFHHEALKQLADQQVRFAPEAKRQEQAGRARKLVTEIDPNKQYPYQYVCYRITDFRPDAHPDLLFSGVTLTEDLHQLIRLLDDPLLTLDELSKQLNVSTKTIRRWRKLGLEGRRDPKGTRRHLVFKQSAIEDFLSTHEERVTRGRQFSQLSDMEREEILCRAKNLCLSGGSLSEVSRRIAGQMGRSAETVRYTIKNYDREHPDQALVPAADRAAGSRYESKQFIALIDGGWTWIHSPNASSAPGIDVSRHQRSTRHSACWSSRWNTSHTLTFEDPANDAEFSGPDARRRSLRSPAPGNARSRRMCRPSWRSMYECPLLSKDQEQHLFRKMNYLKFKASQLRDQLRKDGSDEIEVDPIARPHPDAQARSRTCKPRPTRSRTSSSTPTCGWW